MVTGKDVMMHKQAEREREREKEREKSESERDPEIDNDLIYCSSRAERVC